MSDESILVAPLGPGIRYAMTRARRDGRTLTLTSGYRTREQQIEARRANCGPSNYDLYDKPAALCSPPTARPGSSKHETGEAADMAGDKEWAARLLAPYGIRRPVPGEDWHFEYKGTDPDGDLRKLGRAVAAAGLTDAERAYVAGGDQRALTAADGGPWWQGVPLVPNIPGLGLVTVGSIIGAGEAAGDAITAAVPGAGELAALAGVASRLADPAWWRRVLLGALGVAMVTVGLVLVFRDTLGGIARSTPAGALIPS